MKTINLFIFSLLLSSTLLTSCMPDSLTQFKKDPPAKPKSVTGVPVTDASGRVIDPNTITYPTLFQFRYETDGAPRQEYPLEIYKKITIVPVFNGSMYAEETRKQMVTRCEIDQAGSTVSRTFPLGLHLDSSTCNITGAPLEQYANLAPAVIGSLIRYRINVYYKDAKNLCPGDECTITGELDLASYFKPNSFSLTQNDVLVVPLSISGAFTFTENDNLTTTRTDVASSDRGAKAQVEITDASSSTLSIYRAVPLTIPASVISSFSAGTSISTGTKTGKVLSVDTTNNIIRVVRDLTSASFTVGDTITVPVAATISAINTSDAIRVNDKIDSDTQYYSERGKVREVVQVYEVGKTIDNISVISDSTLTNNNGVTFTITPALPSGLSFNSTTGTISGQFTEPFPKATFTITATNVLGTNSSSATVEAYYPPEDLSYTNTQLLAVLNSNVTTPNSVFIEGERVYRPKLASENASVFGRIFRKISTNKLLLPTLNGSFSSGNSLDSGKKYFSEKAQVDSNVEITESNIVLTLADITNFAIGDYVSTSAGALGRVTDRDTASNSIFVQFLTPNTSSVVKFNQGDGVDDAKTWVANETTISAIETNNYILTLADASTFSSGDDITAVDNSGAPAIWVSGYINDLSGSNLYVSDNNKKGSTFWKNGYSVDVGERFIAPAATTITNVTHDVVYYFESKVNQEIRANLSRGAATYTIDKTLPLGLSLNSTTGKISGTPSSSTPRKTYIVRAKNLLGTTSFKFDFEVRDFLKIIDANANASSFQLHKTGTAQNIRGCRINSKDILNNTNSRALDIRCYLDGQEEDIYFEKIRLQLSVGGGVCQYTQYSPYYFNKFKPGKTSKSVNYLSPGSCDTGAGMPAPGSYVSSTSPQDLCDYYYNDNYNCDDGEVSVTTWTAALDGSSVCQPTSQTAIVKCNGKKARCITGPITDPGMLSSNEIEKGSRSILYSTSAGETIPPIVHNSPQTTLDLTNLRVVNDTEKNFCTDNNSDLSTWSSSVYAYGLLAPYVMPFAGGAASETPREYGQPYYVINCLDAARDIKARIRLVVREWDRNFSIADNIDYNTNADAANTLKDDHLNVSFGSPYNSFLDWDDDFNDTDGDGNYYESSPAVNYSGSCGSVTTSEDGGGLDCYSSGGVQDGSITTPKACYAAGKKWRAGSHFQFPGDNL